jgi:hypothetical protein
VNEHAGSSALLSQRQCWWFVFSKNLLKINTDAEDLAKNIFPDASMETMAILTTARALDGRYSTESPQRNH